MKRIFFLIFISLCSAQLALAQSTVEKFFLKYQDDPSFTVINVTPKMFSMFSKVSVNDPDFKKVSTVVSKLKGLRILVKEETKDGAKLFKEASSFLSSSDLEELMTIRSKDADVKFMVKENAKGNISELIMLVGSPDEFVALSIFGEINLSELSEIAGDFNISGFDNLKSLPKKKP